MADIDVQALGLASPPAQPYQQSYTPGILVRNNGLAAAAATGYLQCFDQVSGVLLDSWAVASGEISPDATGTATADESLDLSEVEPGTVLIFSGYVSTPGDQVPTNNVLNPVLVTVQEGESPEPPTVPAHSSQHEDGGSDELNLAGLRGVLLDAQTPTPHAASHQLAGSDALNVDGLSGELADNQPAKPHDNDRHLEAYSTDADLADHNTSDEAHAESENLEHTANKGQAEGYAGLDATGKVPAAQLPDTPVAEHGADKHDATVEATANKDQVDGYCGLDANTRIVPARLADPTGGVDDKYLRGNQTWDTPVPSFDSPGFRTGANLPVEGTSEAAARADHVHGGAGRHYADSFSAWPCNGGVETLLGIPNVAGQLGPTSLYFKLTGHLYIANIPAPDTITFRIRFGQLSPQLLIAQVPVEAEPVYINISAHVTAKGANVYGLWHLDAGTAPGAFSRFWDQNTQAGVYDPDLDTPFHFSVEPAAFGIVVDLGMVDAVLVDRT